MTLDPIIPNEYSILRGSHMADPTCSNWLRFAIGSLENRDPVDAANDAEALLRLAKIRCEEVAQAAGEGL